MNWKLVANHQIYLHTENWVDGVQDGRLAAIFVCVKWHYLPIFQVSSCSFHNFHTQWIENLWQIMKSIGTQKIGLIGLKMADWRPSLFVPIFPVSLFSVHNLHTQLIENLWQMMKSICTQKIGLIGFKMADWRPCLFSKNWTFLEKILP